MSTTEAILLFKIEQIKTAPILETSDLIKACEEVTDWAATNMPHLSIEEIIQKCEESDDSSALIDALSSIEAHLDDLEDVLPSCEALLEDHFRLAM